MTIKQLDLLKPEDYIVEEQFNERQKFLSDPDNYTGPYDFVNDSDDTSAEDDLEAQWQERHYENSITTWAAER